MLQGNEKNKMGIELSDDGAFHFCKSRVMHYPFKAPESSNAGISRGGISATVRGAQQPGDLKSGQVNAVLRVLPTQL